ncbi:MAG TPA: hypothetical protein DCM38_13930 [Gammaproteobacteria bacterium]|nr:hypothetical protein [Gammaproteobacteria bacterium]
MLIIKDLIVSLTDSTVLITQIYNDKDKQLQGLLIIKDLIVSVTNIAVLITETTTRLVSDSYLKEFRINH